MKPGDMVTGIDDYFEASSVNQNWEFVSSFQVNSKDVGIVINPVDIGGYVKVLLRGRIVWVSNHALSTRNTKDS